MEAWGGSYRNRDLLDAGEPPMTDLAASVPQTTTELSDLIEIALVSLVGLLLSFAFIYGGANVGSALLAAS